MDNKELDNKELAVAMHALASAINNLATTLKPPMGGPVRYSEPAETPKRYYGAGAIN